MSLTQEPVVAAGYPTDLVAAEYPTAPSPPAMKGTLLDIITPIDSENGRKRIPGGIGLYPSFNCIDVGVALNALCGPTTGSKFTSGERPVWQDGLGFGAFGLVVCKLEDPAVLRAGVDHAYELAETGIVEAAIMAGLFVEQTASSTQGGWAEATDITPTPDTPVDPLVGLGLLESHMAANYAPQGIVHMPRVIATLLSTRAALRLEGSVLYTNLGTPVAAGPGYDLPNTGPDGTEPAEGTKWMYATGWVSVIRQKIPTQDWFNIYGQQEDDEAPNFVDGLDPNDRGALAESLYLASIDCYKAAVLVTAYEEVTP